MAEVKNTPESVDKDLSVDEKCKKYGYTLVKHEVVTEDGYILEMH